MVVGVFEAKDMEEIMVGVIGTEVEVEDTDAHSINAPVQMLGLQIAQMAKDWKFIQHTCFLKSSGKKYQAM